MEYIIILGIALALLIPGVIFFASYTQTAASGGTNAQLNDVGLKMMAAVKNTYALGMNSRQTVELTMPASVSKVYVKDFELVFVYDTPQGASEAVFFSQINMSAPDNPSASNTCTANNPNTPDYNISVVHPGITRYRVTMARASPATVCIDEAV